MSHTLTVLEIRRNVIWLLTAGILTFAAGASAIGYSLVATPVSMQVIGWFMVAGGILELIFATTLLVHRNRGRFVIHCILAVVSLTVGVIAVSYPAVAALSVGYALAFFLMINGLVMVIGSIVQRSGSWGWTIANGIVALVLGIDLWRGWPTTGFWAVGSFIGIYFLIRGIEMALLAVALKRGG